MKKLLNTLRRVASLPMYDQYNIALMWLFRLKGILIYRRVFKHFGRRSVIYSPMLIGGPRFISIGHNVIIRKGVRIEAILLDPENPPEIHIGDNVNIEQDVHIVALGKIWIHDNVSITARSSILGGTHPFFDVHDPVKIGERVAGEGSLTEIGEGSFLGIGSIIQMNVKLGKYVVVGSGSVVKKNVPDYCVVDGSPAVIVLRYDPDTNRWQSATKSR